MARMQTNLGRISVSDSHEKSRGGGTLVQPQPVAGYPLECRPQLIVVNRLLDTAVGPELIALRQLSGIV